MTNAYEEFLKGSSTQDEEEDTFSKYIEKEKEKLVEDDFADRLQEKAQVTPACFVKQEQGKVRITHGYHADDYVWHIRPISTRKTWRVPDLEVLRTCARVFNNYIPPNIYMDVFPPNDQWEIKEVTFKGLAFKDWFMFNDALIKEINGILFEELDKLL